MMIDCHSFSEHSANFSEYARFCAIANKRGFLERVKSFGFDRVEIGAEISKDLFGDHERDSGRCFDHSSNQRIYGDDIVSTQLASD